MKHLAEVAVVATPKSLATGETTCALTPRNYACEVLDVQFTLPDDTAAVLGVAPEAVAETVRLAAAMKLYELGRLSVGRAAALAGVAVPVLLARLAARVRARPTGFDEWTKIAGGSKPRVATASSIQTQTS